VLTLRVTGNTDVLVCGAGVGAKKTDDAAKKGVAVWSEDEFVSALSGGGGGGGGGGSGGGGSKKRAAGAAGSGQPAKAAKRQEEERALGKYKVKGFSLG